LTDELPWPTHPARSLSGARARSLGLLGAERNSPGAPTGAGQTRALRRVGPVRHGWASAHDPACRESLRADVPRVAVAMPRLRRPGPVEPAAHDPPPTPRPETRRPTMTPSTSPNPTPQRQARDAGEQHRRAQQSPRRERRCARRRTRTRADLAGEVAAHQRAGAGGVAAHAVGAEETGCALRRSSAGTALGDGSVGGCGGRRAGRGEGRRYRWCRGRRVRDTRPVGGAARARRAAGAAVGRVAAGVAGVGAADGAAAAELAAIAAVFEFDVTDGSRAGAATVRRAAHPAGADGSGRARAHGRSERERDGGNRASDANHSSSPQPGIEPPRLAETRNACLTTAGASANGAGWRAAPGWGGKPGDAAPGLRAAEPHHPRGRP